MIRFGSGVDLRSGTKVLVKMQVSLGYDSKQKYRYHLVPSYLTPVHQAFLRRKPGLRLYNYTLFWSKNDISQHDHWH